MQVCGYWAKAGLDRTEDWKAPSTGVSSSFPPRQGASPCRSAAAGCSASTTRGTTPPSPEHRRPHKDAGTQAHHRRTRTPTGSPVQPAPAIASATGSSPARREPRPPASPRGQGATELGPAGNVPTFHLPTFGRWPASPGGFQQNQYFNSGSQNRLCVWTSEITSFTPPTPPNPIAATRSPGSGPRSTAPGVINSPATPIRPAASRPSTRAGACLTTTSTSTHRIPTRATGTWSGSRWAVAARR